MKKSSSPKKSPENWNLFLTLAFVAAVVVLVIAKYAMRSEIMPIGPGSNGNGGQVACTMEAKICPDGSAVGRQGPNCEFTPCPGE